MGINRREFLTAAAAEGAFILGFWVPSTAAAQSAARGVWYEESATPEINAWIVIVIGTDDMAPQSCGRIDARWRTPLTAEIAAA